MPGTQISFFLKKKQVPQRLQPGPPPGHRHDDDDDRWSGGGLRGLVRGPAAGGGGLGPLRGLRGSRPLQAEGGREAKVKVAGSPHGGAAGAERDHRYFTNNFFPKINIFFLAINIFVEIMNESQLVFFGGTE